MKQLLHAFLALFVFSTAFSQQPEFEGRVAYRNETTSKVEGVSNKAYKSMLLIGDSCTTTIKKGNYRISNAVCETYYIAKDQKVYIRVKGVDTLFYRNYADDATAVKKVSKPRTKKEIAGYTCNALSMELEGYKKEYYYAPALYLNPAHDQHNKVGRFDVVTKETEAVWLASVEEHESYTIAQTCMRVQPGLINDSVFVLPNLPLRPFNYESILTEPEFTATGGWQQFLSRHIDANLGAKYVKVAKGQTTGTEQVIVSFLVSERGRILNAQVANRKDVHPKLAAEAMRVISESPAWKPATVLGEKVPFYMKQPITFSVAIQ